jgi:Tol biopolymer transport system component
VGRNAAVVDGRSIVFDYRPEGQGDLYIINADGGAPRRLTTHLADDVTPSWSRDGNWIYFVSNRSGENQVWKIKPDGSDAVQITQNGGFAALDSPDGQYLYYAKEVASPTSLWRVPAKGGEEKKIIDQLSEWGNFAVVEDGIYFIPYGDPDSETGNVIQFLRFADGHIETIATTEKPPGNGLAVSPDRSFLLYSQRDHEGMDLYLIENFR